MALSKQEQEELAALELKYGKGPSVESVETSSLSPEEQEELTALESKYGNEKPKREPFMGEGMIRGALQALPAAGALGGGVIGSGLGPVGTFGGGLLGAGAGKALQNFGEGLLGDEKTREQIYMDPVREAATESAMMGAGGLIGKTGGILKDYVKAPVANTLSRLARPAKEGAEEITAAAERLGSRPTIGMLSDDRMIQNIESGLQQTPSLKGQEYADKLKSVQKSMTGSAEEIFEPFRTAETPNQLAASARQSMVKGVEEKLAPAVNVYDKIKADTPNIEVSAESMKRIAGNIEKLPYVKILGSKESAFAKQINDNLGVIKTLDELRNLKSYVGATARDKNLPPTMRNTAGEIADKLSKLEQNSITRAVVGIERGKKASKQLAGEMIREIKGANKIYAETSQELKDIAVQAKMGKVNNYADFTRKLETMSDEDLLKTMFKPGNEKLLNQLNKSFPQAFESMKKAKMMELYTSSLTKGEVSIPKLLNNAKNLSAESKKLMFGEKSDQVLKDIEKVYNSMPGKVGPSGTPEGLAYMGFNPFSPTSWYNELASQAKAKVLESPHLFTGFKFTDPKLKNFNRSQKNEALEFGKKQIMQSTVPRGLMSPFQDNK